MKKALLLTVFAILTFTFCKGQLTEYGNFKIVDKDLIFQQIVDSTITINAAANYLRTVPSIKNVEIVNGEYVNAEFEDFKFDLRKYGMKWSNTPIIFNDTFFGRIKVEVKEEKYRLTLYAIKSKSPQMGMYPSTTQDLSFNALNRNKDVINKGWCKPDLLGIMEKDFFNTFSIKATKITKSDW